MQSNRTVNNSGNTTYSSPPLQRSSAPASPHHMKRTATNDEMRNNNLHRSYNEAVQPGED